MSLQYQHVILPAEKKHNPRNKEQHVWMLTSALIFTGELILVFHSPLQHFLEGLNLPRIIPLKFLPVNFSRTLLLLIDQQSLLNESDKLS